MTAVRMDGTALAARVRADVTREVAELGHVGLATVLVGDDPASHVYIAAKHKAATEAGIDARDIRLPADTSEQDVLDLVHMLNADDEVEDVLLARLGRQADVAGIDAGLGRRFVLRGDVYVRRRIVTDEHRRKADVAERGNLTRHVLADGCRELCPVHPRGRHRVDSTGVTQITGIRRRPQPELGACR